MATTHEATRPSALGRAVRRARRTGADASLDTGVIWSTLAWTVPLAFALAALGRLLGPRASFVAVASLALLSLVAVVVLAVNVVYWTVSSRIWSRYTPAERAKVKRQRGGRPMEDDFRRSAIVVRTNALSLLAFVGAIAALVLI